MRKEKSVLRRVQLTQLEILKQIDNICSKYGLKYQLAYGSLLGAIRHGGFIPWDDDLDIFMFRKDYDKFLNIAQKELGDKYFLQTYKTDPNYPQVFAKIRKENTLLEEYSVKNIKMHKGIFVDIFPIDNIPNDRKKASKQRRIVTYNYVLNISRFKRRNYFSNPRNFFKNFFFLFLKPFSLLSSTYYLEKISKAQKLYSFEKALKVGNLSIISSRKRYNEHVFNVSDLEKTKEVKFEDMNVPVPTNYDEILKRIYGDYMKKPPKSQQEPQHNVYKIAFDSKTYYGY